jgi:hypothetical protein
MRIEKACFLVMNKIDTRFCILTGLVRGEPTSVGLLCFLSARVERSLFYETLLVPQLMLQRTCTIAHCKGRG